MSVEELRREAKLLGYKLIPINVKEKLAPCICGYKKREHWSSYKDGVWYEQLKCPKCGMESTPGKTEAEARKNWNIMVKEEIKKKYGENVLSEA